MAVVDVGIVTCSELPEPDFDEDLLLEALKGAGLRVEMRAWDNNEIDWSSGALHILRSCWNYYHRYMDFMAWAEDTATKTRLYNPISAIEWNIHKSYLKKLESRGLPIVPTVLIERGKAGSTLASIMDKQQWEKVVLKPAVSAASFNTYPIARNNVDEALFAQQTRERDMLVQAYVDSVDGYGERALVYIDGQFTHAVRKQPRFCHGDESASEALSIAPDELTLALQAIECVGLELLYGRVDVVRSTTNQPLIMEIELIEPSLFLLQHPEALERLVTAIHRECAARTRVR